MQQVIFFHVHYKKLYVPFLTIGICAVLLFFVILPQLQAILVTRKQLSEEETTLQTVQSSFAQITNMSDTELATDFMISTMALPQEKDPVAIVSSISHAAQMANISLKDYTFEIPETNEPEVPVELFLEGEQKNLVQFIHLLLTGFPLAAVNKLSIETEKNASLEVVFYTEPVTSHVLDTQVPLPLLTATETTTLKQLQAWSLPE